VNNITKEIKEVFNEYKRNSDLGPVCESLPFSPKDQMWMYYYLYPEVLIMYDECILEQYKKYMRSYIAEFANSTDEYSSLNVINLTIEEYKKIMFTNNGEATIFPCWVLSEEEVLRIMEECGILEGGKNE